MTADKGAPMTTSKQTGTQLVTPSLAQTAYDNLQRLIVTCRLEPGSWVSEAELCDLSGQARTPTREAAMRLISEQLLEVIPRQGYRIAPVSVESARQLQSLIGVLFGEVVRTATAPVPVGTVRRFRAFLEHPPSDTSPHRLDDLLDLAALLSGSFIANSGNVWLQGVLMPLMSHTIRLWTFAWRNMSMTEVIELGFRPLLILLDEKIDDQVEARATIERQWAWIERQTLAGIAHRLSDAAAVADV
jgi:DNA-binding GntR family transcriptional regulator